jgi:hypothetical protein
MGAPGRAATQKVLENDVSPETHFSQTVSPWNGPMNQNRKAELAALSIEFVAKPQEAYRVHTSIPEAIEAGLGQVEGFAGCLVMVSNQEARLVTVVTFWSGEGRETRCGNSAPWVHKLLSPYLDHCLGVRTLRAYPPIANGSGANESEREISLRVA